MTDTLTHDEIDGLSGRELDEKIAIALNGGEWPGLDAVYRRHEDTDAALALCVETGWLFKITYHSMWEVWLTKVNWEIDGCFHATGNTLAEAALRAWLKWKAAQ